MDELEKDLNTFDKNGLWPYIFQHIRKESLKQNNNYSTEEAKKTENRKLNRYEDVQPFDHNRVVLLRSGYDYINASKVCIREVSKSYILTQGPLPNTIHHFWLMIWEQNSKIIIMLNRVIEKNQVKCTQYWPDLVNSKMKLPDIDLTIELLSEENFFYYIVRYFRLINTKCNEERTIIQYHYIMWPDFGVPQSSLEFLKFLKHIQRSSADKAAPTDDDDDDDSNNNNNNNVHAPTTTTAATTTTTTTTTTTATIGPPIVHCSAGIGRSGTFCLIDLCLSMTEQIREKTVTITNTLLQMRSCRMGLVQTSDQLRFCYLTILQGLKVNWDSLNERDLFDEELDHLSKRCKLAQKDDNDDDEDTPPPLPPPRSCSFQVGKPLPQLPPVPASVATESSSASDTDGDEIIIDNSSRRKESSSVKENCLLPPPRSLSEKIQQMKKKQVEAEKWKKRKITLVSFSTGISIIAISGAIIAYFWLGKVS